MDAMVSVAESLGFALPEGYTFTADEQWQGTRWFLCASDGHQVGRVEQWAKDYITGDGYDYRVCGYRGTWLDTVDSLPEAVRFLLKDQCDIEV